MKLATAKASRQSSRDRLLAQKKVSAKVSGKVQDIKKAYTGLKTVPKPFALSKSKRTNVSLVIDDVDS